LVVVAYIYIISGGCYITNLRIKIILGVPAAPEGYLGINLVPNVVPFVCLRALIPSGLDCLSLEDISIRERLAVILTPRFSVVFAVLFHIYIIADSFTFSNIKK